MKLLTKKQEAKLLDVLRAAVARVELANAEGDPILSAWLPGAKDLLAQVPGKGAK